MDREFTYPPDILCLSAFWVFSTVLNIIYNNLKIFFVLYNPKRLQKYLSIIDILIFSFKITKFYKSVKEKGKIIILWNIHKYQS